MATDGDENVASRRRSGRVIRKPELYGDEDHATSSPKPTPAKRKRVSTVNGKKDDADSDNDAESSADDEDTQESELDEEELKDQRKKQRKTASRGQPAAKRPKTANGTSTTLAIRPAAAPPATGSKSAKIHKARSRPSQIHSVGLYAEVFGRGNSAEDAAAEWHELMQKDNVAGIRDLVNFVLQCIGCEVRIESADVEDIDNVPSKLGDVLEEYARQNSSDYPLSSKLKQHTGFREVLCEFFKAVVHALHNSGVLYDDPAVYDNIHIWTATMSGAGFRPFRHTAGLISLSMTTALCQIAQQLQSSMATTKTQLEAEKKKKSTNKSRVTKLQEDMKRDEARLSHVDELLRDAFDTVYVHRYRDVDERIRVECVIALGQWIVLYRKMFLDGQYLRYLGWLLSDPNAPTRLEVIRALKALFKNRGNVAALRAFTDRFRSRIVEMGSRDTDTSVRVEAIELLDRLRNAELLEPEDVDTIGQLIFDDELRVRKAVAKFFVSNIDDLYLFSIHKFDEEQYASVLPKVDDIDDYSEPCQSWIKFKCLAQTLTARDQQHTSRKNGEHGHDIYGPGNAESRYMLATQSIYPYMTDLQHWESLAGYLLFDHSSIDATVKDSADVSEAVPGAYKLESGEDTVLLDVLQFCVKLYLQQLLEAEPDKKSKRSKASRDDAQKKQEMAAHSLTQIIPQLLNKYGGTPDAAATILRLEQLLNIDLINDLQSGEASYTDILEGINRQFNSHNDRNVLAEASRAFRAARTYETSQQAVDAKVAEIWAECKESLNSLLHNKNISTRGTVDRNVLGETGDTVERLAQLAAVSDCTEILESRMTSGGGRKSKGKVVGQDNLLDTLLQLVSRGIANEDTTEQFNELEDRLTSSVLTVFSFYFRWRVVGLKNAIAVRDTRSLSTGTLTSLALRRTNFVEALMPVISSRQPLDPVRIAAILTLLDLFTLCATVRHMRPDKGELSEDLKANLSSLSIEVSQQLVDLVMETHEKMEKRLARKTKKRIDLHLDKKKGSGRSKKRFSETGAELEDNSDDDQDDVEKPPEDSEDEAEADSESSSDDGDVSAEDEHESGAKGREARKQAALVAEQALCELVSKIVLAIIAGILGRDGKIKARLQVNRSRLGKSYGQVIAYLDEKKPKAKSKPKVLVAGGPAQTPGQVSETAAAAAAIATSAAVTSAQKSQANAQKQHQQRKSEPLVIEDDDIEDDDDDRESVEEGDEEDLQRRGLVDDDIEDPEEDANEAEEAEAQGNEEDDDEVMGD